MSQRTKQLLFVAVGVVGLIKFALLFFTGGLLGVINFAVWFSWFSFILFVVLMWVLYAFAFKSKYSVGTLIIMMVTVALIIGTVGFFTQAITVGDDRSDSDNSDSSQVKDISKITAVKVSDVIGSNGQVETGKSSISPDAPEMQVSVYIKDAKKGTYLTLTDIDPLNEIPTKLYIASDGDTVITSRWGKPTGGWLQELTGSPVNIIKHTFKAKLSNGETGTAEITVQ